MWLGLRQRLINDAMTRSPDGGYTDVESGYLNNIYKENSPDIDQCLTTVLNKILR